MCYPTLFSIQQGYGYSFCLHGRTFVFTIFKNRHSLLRSAPLHAFSKWPTIPSIFILWNDNLHKMIYYCELCLYCTFESIDGSVDTICKGVDVLDDVRLWSKYMLDLIQARSTTWLRDVQKRFVKCSHYWFRRHIRINRIMTKKNASSPASSCFFFDFLKKGSMSVTLWNAQDSSSRGIWTVERQLNKQNLHIYWTITSYPVVR
jgi:hypothetical protein